MSQITTHILDTTLGKPAQGVTIALYHQTGSDWREIALRTTNADGRIADLLPKDKILSAGIYKMYFETQAYFDGLGVATFYPFVEIVFQITGAGEHYHVPLLLNPFGYSTYRGS
jgi:5-hydroxyisourate hydrolase